MTFQYTIKAISTTYKGINFRSRLEARWAAFFDLMGWRWDYEPLDFDGWIPDFILHGAKERVLVEVKPIFTAHEDLFQEVSRQALSANSRDDILVLGAHIIEDRCCHGGVAFGWLGEFISAGQTICGDDLVDVGPLHDWGHAAPHDGGGKIGFCHEFMSYGNRITGYWSGDSGVGGSHLDRAILRAWKDAGNTVQWKPSTNQLKAPAISKFRWLDHASIPRRNAA